MEGPDWSVARLLIPFLVSRLCHYEHTEISELASYSQASGVDVGVHEVLLGGHPQLYSPTPGQPGVVILSNTSQ